MGQSVTRNGKATSVEAAATADGIAENVKEKCHVRTCITWCISFKNSRSGKNLVALGALYAALRAMQFEACPKQHI